MFRKIREKLGKKIFDIMQNEAQSQVAQFENDLVEKIAHRLEVLFTDVNNNYDVEYIINDIRNKGYNLQDNERGDVV